MLSNHSALVGWLVWAAAFDGLLCPRGNLFMALVPDVRCTFFSDNIDSISQFSSDGKMIRSRASEGAERQVSPAECEVSIDSICNPD